MIKSVSRFPCDILAFHTNHLFRAIERVSFRTAAIRRSVLFVPVLYTLSIRQKRHITLYTVPAGNTISENWRHTVGVERYRGNKREEEDTKEGERE